MAAVFNFLLWALNMRVPVIQIYYEESCIPTKMGHFVRALGIKIFKSHNTDMYL